MLAVLLAQLAYIGARLWYERFASLIPNGAVFFGHVKHLAIMSCCNLYQTLRADPGCDGHLWNG